MNGQSETTAAPAWATRDRPLDAAVSRWLAFGALACCGHGFVKTFAAIGLTFIQRRQLWFLSPSWTQLFFFIWVAMQVSWLIAGIRLLRSPGKGAAIVRIAAGLSAVILVSHSMFYWSVNTRGERWYERVYHAVFGSDDAFPYVLLGAFGLAVMRHRRRRDDAEVRPADVLRWSAVGAICCAACFLGGSVQNTLRDAYDDLRYLSRPNFREVAQFLVTAASFCWVVAGLLLLRRRAGAATLLEVASWVWASGALCYVVHEIFEYGRRDPWYYRVYEALNFVGWFFYGVVFAVGSTIALRHPDVRAVVQRRAGVGFTPILLQHPDNTA